MLGLVTRVVTQPYYICVRSYFGLEPEILNTQKIK